MQIITSVVTLALAAGVSARPAIIARAEYGCQVNLDPTDATPSAPGENILLHSMSKWAKSTDTSYFTSDWLNTSQTTSSPYSITFLAGDIPGYTTNAEIKAVLDTWEIGADGRMETVWHVLTRDILLLIEISNDTTKFK
ncbi:hypothetical protein F5Y15DRAFT_411581 [Xylariaceae sp. FL0016]|nr:hypothetical protein F5Y15DRAFT_411581 [Xylariaceae sp. FL0016]